MKRFMLWVMSAGDDDCILEANVLIINEDGLRTEKVIVPPPKLEATP
jgi:hypothetical protein